MGTNHSLCWSLLFGLALRQVAAPLYTVESFSPYNSTLQTNDCKACALLQRLSNFLLIFHNFYSNPPGVIAVAPELFPFLLCTTHPSTPNAQLRFGCKLTSHTYIHAAVISARTRGGRRGWAWKWILWNLFNFGGDEGGKRKTNKSGPFPVVLLRKNSTRF
jgi:hypothetical protein